MFFNEMLKMRLAIADKFINFLDVTEEHIWETFGTEDEADEALNAKIVDIFDVFDISDYSSGLTGPLTRFGHGSTVKCVHLSLSQSN